MLYSSVFAIALSHGDGTDDKTLIKGSILNWLARLAHTLTVDMHLSANHEIIFSSLLCYFTNILIMHDA